MSALTLVTIYIAVICTIVLIVWTISATRLHKKRINNLSRNDKIKVCTEFDATYLYRIDTNTHRVKIDTTVHDVNFKDIVKVLSVTILLMLTLSGFSQEIYLNLDWSRQNVKVQNRNRELIYSAYNYLEYKTQYGFVAYEFADKTCTACLVSMDSIAGVRLVKLRESQLWKLTEPNRWEYYSDCMGEVIRVTADWCGQAVTFKYTLKD